MNIFMHELRAYRKSTIVWTLSLIAIGVIFLSFYASFAKDADEFAKVMEGYPEAIRNLFGVNFGRISTILGFYCFPLSFITLCGAVQAMNLGTSIISKETREKTADFLLTKPVTRTAVISAKLVAAFTSLVITNLLYMAAAGIMAFQVKTDDFSMKLFIMLSLTIFFVQLIFLALGSLVSVIFSKIKSVLTVSLATVFAFYFLGMFTSTTDDEVKRSFSPFKYFDPSYILDHSSYETEYLIMGAVIIIMAIFASYLIYVKKDVHTV
jgi:ABC-2 type transport system permease protein